MGDASNITDALSEYEVLDVEDLRELIDEMKRDENCLSEIEEKFKAKLEGWKNNEINIGVTGNSGVGKSSVINTIRK